MNSISIVQCVFKKNPYIAESLKLNLEAINQSEEINEYEYIIFNDNGDKSIYDDISDIIESNNNVRYIYSDINFGMKKCRGGWLGSIPHLTKDLIHIADQDDVMTATFYDESMTIFKHNTDIDLVTCNAFRVNDDFSYNSIMSTLQDVPLYFQNPLEAFKSWFGIGNDNKVTSANNYFLASGTVYRRSLHNIIGLPSIEEFEGACDFEYWARVLFNKRKCFYIKNPLWMYRLSEYSAGLEVIDGKQNNDYHRKIAIQKIKEKYTRLWTQQINLSNTISIT
tara:strand:+ start:1423 stop:2262 length:840 start_codon:yes stop_codon:yes gene_type:complete